MSNIEKLFPSSADVVQFVPPPSSMLIAGKYANPHIVVVKKLEVWNKVYDKHGN